MAIFDIFWVVSSKLNFRVFKIIFRIHGDCKSEMINSSFLFKLVQELPGFSSLSLGRSEANNARHGLVVGRGFGLRLAIIHPINSGKLEFFNLSVPKLEVVNKNISGDLKSTHWLVVKFVNHLFDSDIFLGVWGQHVIIPQILFDLAHVAWTVERHQPEF